MECAGVLMAGAVLAACLGGATLIVGNWADISVAAGGTGNNANVTPTGYVGTRTLTIAPVGGGFLLGGTVKYRINSGTYTTFAASTDISITAGDTLNFQYISGGSGETGSITVTDKSRATLMDTIACTSGL